MSQTVYRLLRSVWLRSSYAHKVTRSRDWRGAHGCLFVWLGVPGTTLTGRSSPWRSPSMLAGTF